MSEAGPQYLPKTQALYAITLGVRATSWEFWIQAFYTEGT